MSTPPKTSASSQSLVMDLVQKNLDASAATAAAPEALASPNHLELPAPVAAPEVQVAAVAPAPATVDYPGLFLTRVRGRKGKAVYLPDELHVALVNITKTALDGVTLSDLLVNIVNHHFETFGPAIRKFLTAQDRLRQSKLPY